MKAAVYHDIGDIRYEEIAQPAIGPGEVLVRLGVCGLCGTDIHKILHKSVKTPAVLGHEVAGEVVETGSGVTSVRVGDRVFVAHHVPCFTCRHCLRGHHTLCAQFRATNLDPGGFAEYIRVSAAHVKSTLLPIPDGVTDAQAAMTEPLATVVHGAKLLRVMHGDRVLVMGAGQIGVIWAQILRNMNADTVIVSDVSEFKLQQARRFGADVTVDVTRENLVDAVRDATEGLGVDVVVIAVGVSQLLAEAVSCCAPGGQVMVFAGFDEKPIVPIDASRFFNSEISIIGSYSSMPTEYAPSLAMIAKGLIRVDEMITHRFPLSQLQQAVDVATNPAAGSLKVILTP